MVTFDCRCLLTMPTPQHLDERVPLGPIDRDERSDGERADGQPGAAQGDDGLVPGRVLGGALLGNTPLRGALPTARRTAGWAGLTDECSRPLSFAPRPVR